MKYKLYTLDNEFIEGTDEYPDNFTGIIEYSRLSKTWFVNGRYHRIDGPAWIWATGDKEWFLYNKQVTEEQCKLLHDIMKLKGLI